MSHTTGIATACIKQHPKARTHARKFTHACTCTYMPPLFTHTHVCTRTRKRTPSLSGSKWTLGVIMEITQENADGQNLICVSIERRGVLHARQQ